MVWHVVSGRLEPDSGEKVCVKARILGTFEAHLCVALNSTFCHCFSLCKPLVCGTWRILFFCSRCATICGDRIGLNMTFCNYIAS
jgi:hypothetical protein